MSIIPRLPLTGGRREAAELGKGGAMRHAADMAAGNDDVQPGGTVEVVPDDPWSPEIGLVDGAWHVYVPLPVGAHGSPRPPWASDQLPGARLTLLTTCATRVYALAAARDWLAQVDPPS